MSCVTITEQQRRAFVDEGYFMLRGAIDAATLDLLRSECDRLVRIVDAQNANTDRKGGGLTHVGRRYNIGVNRDRSELVWTRVLFSDLMADICRATIGDTAFQFGCQFVVKAAEKGMSFGWHQDSGYIGHEHRPYVTIWCPLDDVSESNGTVYLLPFSRAAHTRNIQKHTIDPATNDKVGYFGDDPGVAVIAKAGDIAVFSSRLFHRSGSNVTPKARRIFLAQYTPEVIMTADGARPWGGSAAFLPRLKS